MPTHLGFTLGPARPGLPLTTAAHRDLARARAGGGGTAAFFRRQDHIATLVRHVAAAGPSAWSRGAAPDGAPTFVAARRTGRGTLALTLRADLHASASGGAAGAAFTWDGTDHHVVGTLTGTFTFDKQPVGYVMVPVGLADAAAAAAVTSRLWTGVAWPLLRSFGQGVARCFAGALSGVEGLEGTALLAGEAAEAAALEGEVVAGEVVAGEVVAGEVVTMSLAAGAAAFIGLIALVAIPFVIELLLHDSYHVVKLYNLTPYDLTWSPPYLYEGVMSVAPVMTAGGTQYDHRIPGVSESSPLPGIRPVPVAHEASFTLVSGSKLHGLGWAMELEVGASGAHGRARVLFDVPFSGANSLDCELRGGDLRGYYQQMQGRRTKTRFTTRSGDLALTVTYDALTGTQPATPGGEQRYLYNSVIVLETVAPRSI